MIISCRRFVSMLTEAREGTLSPGHQRSFRFHHKVCTWCQCYVDGFDRTVELLHELPPERAPEQMRAELLARLRAGKTEG